MINKMKSQPMEWDKKLISEGVNIKNKDII